MSLQSLEEESWQLVPTMTLKIFDPLRIVFVDIWEECLEKSERVANA